MYTIHLIRLIGKLVVDFLVVLIDLFLLGVIAEALRARVVVSVSTSRSRDSL